VSAGQVAEAARAVTPARLAAAERGVDLAVVDAVFTQVPIDHTGVHHGYRVERRPSGRWRTWRPDDAEIHPGLDSAVATMVASAG
jgi:hypothetical protein